jgi:hypothetical protein
MGNVSADGKRLWVSGRFDDVVYAINTSDGRCDRHPGREGAARACCLAAARPLFVRAHRQHSELSLHGSVEFVFAESQASSRSVRPSGNRLKLS